MRDCSPSKHFDEKARGARRRAAGSSYNMMLAAPRMARAIRQSSTCSFPDEGAYSSPPVLGASLNVQARTIETIYQVVGEGTAFMTQDAEGVECALIGVMGRGWQPVDGNILLVGGVGAAPLFLFAEELAQAGRSFEVILVLSRIHAGHARRLHAAPRTVVLILGDP